MPKKTKSKEIVKPLTKEEVQKRLANGMYFTTHPEYIYHKLWKLLTKDYDNYTDDEKDYLQAHARSVNNFNKSHIWVAETQDEWNLRTTIIELTNDIINEYKCYTTLEKSLAEIIANNYWKVLQFSRKITSNLNSNYLSNERNNWINTLSKELDRANRNYLTSINNLIEIKRPQMNVNVKTSNAYFGNNQQFNNNSIKDENIKN